MEDDKEISKKKKKSRKKKNSTLQDKILNSNSDQSSHHDNSIAPSPHIASGLVIDLSEQHSSLGSCKPTLEDANPSDPSQCTPKVEAIVKSNEDLCREESNGLLDQQHFLLESSKPTLEDCNALDLSQGMPKIEAFVHSNEDLCREEGNSGLDLKESNESQSNSTSIRQEKGNLVRSWDVESESSIVDSELKSVSHEMGDERADKNDLESGKFIASAVTLFEKIENPNVDSLFTDISQDVGIDHLKVCLEKEVKTSALLRLQISTLEELVAMREMDEVKSKAQIKQLKAENEHLENEVLKLKDMVKALMHDRTQLLGRIVAMQDDKLLPNELEASIDGPPTSDPLVHEHTLDTTKEEPELVSTNDLLGRELVSEPSRQDAVGADNLNKLAAEYSGLIHQNQHLSLENQGSGTLSAVEQLQAAEMSTPVIKEAENSSDTQLISVSVVGDPLSVDSDAGIRTSDPDTNKEIERSDSSTEIKDIIENEDISDVNKKFNAQEPNGSHDTMGSPKNQLQEISGQVHLSDSPLLGAPFRLVSFMARYVSGADLASKNAR